MTISERSEGLRPESERPRVAVIGGGLAGLATAVAAADSGWAPLVLEKRPYLGGRAFSFVDRETGVEIDNGQHVFLGACTEYIAFLKRVGAWGNVRIQPRLDMPVIRNGKVSNLRWSRRVPRSLGLLPSLLGYRHLRFPDKLRVAYGMLKIRALRRDRDGATLDSQTFDGWLRRHGQNDATIQSLWNLIVLPALNDDISVVSADAGVMLFQTALLGGSDAAAIGYSQVALTKLAGEAAARYLEARGGRVRTSTEVAGLEIEDSCVRSVVTTAGERFSCDAAVLAIPHFAIGDVLANGLSAREPFSSASRLESAPIVGVHIWYDRPVMKDVFVAVLDSPVQWVFNVDRMHSPSPSSRALTKRPPPLEGGGVGAGEIRIPPPLTGGDPPGFAARPASPIPPPHRGEGANSIPSPHGGEGQGGALSLSKGEGPAQHVVISLSGAWKWAQMTREELRDVFVPEMARVFPAARDAKVTRFISVKQVQATFRSVPGTAALRPGAATPVRNLFLAGDWVATGWPSTMESAVRSGNQAARLLAGLKPRRVTETGEPGAGSP
ncbi:MAG: FAD-dependent oxidoreductase [Chloroflexi bacterium]|nr:FAD-dependent oxidoreductase [Chloroflexota bacterium]